MWRVHGRISGPGRLHLASCDTSLHRHGVECCARARAVRVVGHWVAGVGACRQRRACIHARRRARPRPATTRLSYSESLFLELFHHANLSEELHLLTRPLRELALQVALRVRLGMLQALQRLRQTAREALPSLLLGVGLVSQRRFALLLGYRQRPQPARQLLRRLLRRALE